MFKIMIVYFKLADSTTGYIYAIYPFFRKRTAFKRTIGQLIRTYGENGYTITNIQVF